MHNHDREQSFAKTALALMTDVGVAATPDNFELFYAYASGENPALTQLMAAFIHAKKEFTSEILSDLKLRCLSGARTAQMMDSLGGNIDGLIEKVLSQLESSARDTADYKDTLSAATGQLVVERSPADVRKLVDGLVAATRAMEHRAKSLEGELQASSQQVSELRTKLADVRKESMTDPLTHIANRKAFDESIRGALAAVAEEGEAATLLLCDIDHFKNFNDNWGHQTGDQVLRLVAACLAENVKGRDTAARYGGEEFAVLLPGTTGEEAFAFAKWLGRRVQRQNWAHRPVTISAGVAVAARGESGLQLAARADVALYRSKRDGRNRVTLSESFASAV